MDHLKEILAKTEPVDEEVFQSYNASEFDSGIVASTFKNDFISNGIVKLVEEQELGEIFVSPAKKARPPPSPSSISLARQISPCEDSNIPCLLPEILTTVLKRPILKPEIVVTIRRRRNREDHSLSAITKRFVDYVTEEPGRKCKINEAAIIIGIQHKRRLYDVLNVLEGAGLIEKKKNSVRWIAGKIYPEDDIDEMKADDKALERKNTAIRSVIRNNHMILSQQEDIDCVYSVENEPTPVCPKKNYVVVQTQPGTRYHVVPPVRYVDHNYIMPRQLSICGCAEPMNEFFLQQENLSRKSGNRPTTVIEEINQKAVNPIRNEDHSYMLDHEDFPEAYEESEYSVAPVDSSLSPSAIYYNDYDYDRTNNSDLYDDDDMIYSNDM